VSAFGRPFAATRSTVSTVAAAAPAVARVVPGTAAAETTAGFFESDFEFIELKNISSALTLDLSNVRFTKGVDRPYVAVVGVLPRISPPISYLIHSQNN